MRDNRLSVSLTCIAIRALWCRAAPGRIVDARQDRAVELNGRLQPAGILTSSLRPPLSPPQAPAQPQFVADTPI